jgi:beta-glucosidase
MKEEMIKYKGGSLWAGWQVPWEKFVYAVNVGQKYIMENTTVTFLHFFSLELPLTRLQLGIPALIQSESLHGFLNNGTLWPSPIGLAASFNTKLLEEAAQTIATEAEVLGITHLFAPVLDLARELRWGRVEEGFGEDQFLFAFILPPLCSSR